MKLNLVKPGKALNKAFLLDEFHMVYENTSSAESKIG